jgi:hypothetical protein
MTDKVSPDKASKQAKPIAIPRASAKRALKTSGGPAVKKITVSSLVTPAVGSAGHQPSGTVKFFGAGGRRVRSVTAVSGMTDEKLGKLGRAMNKRLMAEVAANHPDDRVVMFLVESGRYITAKDDSALLDKYTALHKDERGWVTDIVRGPSEHDASVGRP